jgi:hypothetical protein
MRRKLPSVLATLLGTLLIPVAVAAAPPNPQPGSANVDGNPGEWNAADQFTTLHRQNDPSLPAEATVSLRYDCATGTLYAYVDVLGTQQIRTDDPTHENYIRIGDTGKLVHDGSGDDGTPPDFLYINPVGLGADGFEASGAIPEGTYAMRVHIKILDDSGDGYHVVERRDVPLVIECKPEKVCPHSLHYWQCRPCDVLLPLLGTGIYIGKLDVDTCIEAQKILNKKSLNGTWRGNDAAYILAAQLLAAKLNVRYGAEKCHIVACAMSYAQELLEAICFNGNGSYLCYPSLKRVKALILACILDAYNDNKICGCCPDDDGHHSVASRVQNTEESATTELSEEETILGGYIDEQIAMEQLNAMAGGFGDEVSGARPAALKFQARGVGFSLELPEAAEVSVRVYDVQGRERGVLAQGTLQPGVHDFSMRSGDASKLPRGMYFARAELRLAGRVEVRTARIALTK